MSLFVNKSSHSVLGLPTNGHGFQIASYASGRVFRSFFRFIRKHMSISTRPLISVLLLLASLSAQAQPKPILVGQTYVQTGPLASLATEPLIGIRAMFKAVNATGGVHGSTIELRQLDDAYDAAQAGENVKKLARDGAVAILMPIAPHRLLVRSRRPTN